MQYLQQRLPGYDTSEYLRELNSAYVHVWEEVTKLKNHYFTNIKTVTVVNPQFQYDLMFNADNGLSAPISSRLYQVTRIRVRPPAGGLYQATIAVQPQSPDFIAISANPASSASQSGPYYWYLSGRNQINWALPMAVGTVIEVAYTFWPISLIILANGTVSSATNTVTGSSTNFTNILQPDFQAFLPAVQAQEEVQCEFLCNGQLPLGGQIYRVTTITTDTAMTTNSQVNPVLSSGSQYILATLPEIPREHIRVIASLAMRNMYSVAGDDARVGEWTGIAEKNIAMMKDALIERQGQNPPSKIRFPYGIGRKNRAFLR